MSEQERTTVVLQRNAQPYRLQLIRGQKGGYGWKIDIAAETRDELLYHVDLIDAYLRGKYLSEISRIGIPQKTQAPNNADPHTRMEKAIENVKRAAEKGPFRGE